MFLSCVCVCVKFEYQGHWVKFKVISWKMLILLPGCQFLTWFDLCEVKVINEVKVIGSKVKVIS